MRYGMWAEMAIPDARTAACWLQSRGQAVRRIECGWVLSVSNPETAQPMSDDELRDFAREALSANFVNMTQERWDVYTAAGTVLP